MTRLHGSLPGLPQPPNPTLVASVSFIFTTVDGSGIEMHQMVWVPEPTKRAVANLLWKFAKELRESERKIIPAPSL